MSDGKMLVEGVIQKLTGGGKSLQPKRLLNRLSEITGLSVIGVEEALAALAKDGLIEGVNRRGQPVKRVIWKGLSLVDVNPLAQHIKDSLIGHGLTPLDNDILALAKAMSGLDIDDVNQLLAGLLALQDQLGDAVFSSADKLLGSAKALRGLSSANRLLDALPSQQVGEMFVITSGPLKPESVVLIENIRSFTAFADSRHAGTVLGIASYGYGLNMQNFGEQLFAGKVTACPCRGERPDLRRIIQSRPVFFWGDLDQEGLRIYEDMKERLPRLSLSAAYLEMEKLASDLSRSHPYHRLFEKDGQRCARGITPEEVAHLSRVCRERAVDQEALGEDIDWVSVAKPYRIPG